MIFPVITLYQPWATWIMRGWKTIETRTHNRFGCLLGKTILIHAGQTTDANAVNNPYLTKDQITFKPEEIINGCILGSAFVKSFGKLSERHSAASLIECATVERWGLYLKNVKIFEKPIPCKGEMSIWYFDTETNQKILKQKNPVIKPTLF